MCVFSGLFGVHKHLGSTVKLVSVMLDLRNKREEKRGTIFGQYFAVCLMDEFNFRRNFKCKFVSSSHLFLSRFTLRFI